MKFFRGKSRWTALLLLVCILTAELTVDRSASAEQYHTKNVNSSVQNTDHIELYARSAVLMDGDSGRILYGKEADDPMPMASTTKIMTCILALEQTNGGREQVCTGICQSGVLSVRRRGHAGVG